MKKKIRKCNKCRTGMNNIAPNSFSPAHYYCSKCQSHHYDGRYWTKKQWNKYVNDLERKVVRMTEFSSFNLNQ
ncbi:MAG: hypothetical protein KAU20_02280 [Nanoarchaeota archaeon]|nr:hypothetical protein [Nanoarchaeota archaeon]